MAKIHLQLRSVGMLKDVIDPRFFDAAELGVPDKEIQGILRHSDVRLTQNIYIKTIDESRVSAMDALAEKFQTVTGRIQ